MTDPFDLDRFIGAQAQSYDRALSEIRAGAKQSHWMWFIFPQLAGLGHSAMAQRYAIPSIQAARAYLAHPTLGLRYRECVLALQALPHQPAEAVFGGIDAIKLQSSMTLFTAASDEPLFKDALYRWFGGKWDEGTMAHLAAR